MAELIGSGAANEDVGAVKELIIPAPDGLFDPYYNTVFTPEEIQSEIDSLRASDPTAALLRERLYSYRFYTRKEVGKEIVSDRFLAFWVELLYYDKTVEKSKFRLKMARKSLERLLDNKKLSEMFFDRWPDERVLYEQLYSAARRYFITCQTDRNYSSHMFGFVAIKRPQLIEKIVAEFFDAAICFSWRCGLLTEYPFVGKAALNAWSDEFPEMDDIVWRRIEKNLGAEPAAEIAGLLSRD